MSFGQQIEFAGQPQWSFLRRPFWLFSHVFVAACVVAFVNFGFWQLRRLDDRKAANAELAAVIDARPELLAAADDIDGLAEFQPVEVAGHFLDADLAHVVNRSQNGVAGEYVVAILELADGSVLAVNRGFVPIGNTADLSAPGLQQLTGWVRPSVTQERFGATDPGSGSVLPRFNTDDVALRLGQPVPGNWIQVAPASDTDRQLPTPVPLPAITNGPHFSYAVQWFSFAVLTVLFYGAMLRRQANQPIESATAADPQ